MFFSHQCVISVIILICFQTSHTGSEAIPNSCHPNIDVRFGAEINKLNKSSSSSNKKPHAEVLSYDNLAHAFLSTANLALKLAGNECRQDVCVLARNKLNVVDIPEVAMAYTALANLPYGLQILLCSDVVIRSVVLGEIVFADDQHENKVQSARTKSVENAAYLWRFEPVDDEKCLQFRIRNVKTNQYLTAERKFSQLSNALRRVVYTDPTKSDVWELKMMSDWNGNFNRFMIMNVQLGEYLYAARGFCLDEGVSDRDCATRPLFTWEYKTFQEAEDDEYNKFVIDDFAVGYNDNTQ